MVVLDQTATGRESQDDDAAGQIQARPLLVLSDSSATSACGAALFRSSHEIFGRHPRLQLSLRACPSLGGNRAATSCLCRFHLEQQRTTSGKSSPTPYFSITVSNQAAQKLLSHPTHIIPYAALPETSLNSKYNGYLCGLHDCQPVSLQADSRPDGSLTGAWRKELKVTVEPSRATDRRMSSLTPSSPRRSSSSSSSNTRTRKPFNGLQPKPRKPSSGWSDHHIQLALERWKGGFSGQSFK